MIGRGGFGAGAARAPIRRSGPPARPMRTPPMRSRDFDARLAERALREAWPVPEDRRAELVAKLIDVALAEDTPPRERVSAIKALLMAGRLNIEAIRTAQ